jgi:hypothetical protein
MQSDSLKTKPGSLVIFTADWKKDQQELSIILEARDLDKDFKPKQEAFKADLSKSLVEVQNSLKLSLRIEETQDDSTEITKRSSRQAVSWKAAVNRKRRRIDEVILNYGASSYREIARESGCHVSSVKAAFVAKQLGRPTDEYQYNNLHSQVIESIVDGLIQDPANKYMSIGDLKRMVETKQAGCRVSRKWISTRLKSHGLRYLKLQRQRKAGDKRKFNVEDLKQVVWTAAQAWKGQEELLLYMDEVEFPLNNTADYCWCKPDDKPVYNRRVLEQSLHVIAICSSHSMVAFQIFTNKITREAVHFFLSEVIKRQAADKKITILLDNAAWHVAKLIKESSMASHLLYNVAYCWEANLIENAFSKLKSLWRRRKVVDTMEEEIDSLVRIMLDGASEADFKGYRRQYLRQLLVLVQDRLNSVS